MDNLNKSQSPISNTEVVLSDQKPSKRSYKFSNKHKLIKSFEEIEFSSKELQALGVLREVVKPQYVEIISRSNYEVIKCLRTAPESIRIQDLAVISNMATQRLLELEKAGEQPEKVDWDKISREAFETPLDDPNSSQKSE